MVFRYWTALCCRLATAVPIAAAGLVWLLAAAVTGLSDQSAPAIAKGAGARVAVVFAQSRIYEASAAELAKHLAVAGHKCTSIPLPFGDDAGVESALERLVALRPTVVAAGGTAATQQVLESVPDVPVVYFMVPNARDAAFVSPKHPDHHRVCGVAADVDPAAQLRWVRKSHPTAQKVCVLFSDRTRKTAEALQAAGKKHDLGVVLVRSSRTEFVKSLEAVEQADCDGVLMVPDSGIYNSATVKRLLVWGARQRKAVWSFSRNVVRAGAFGGLYCDQDAVGVQAARLVGRVIDQQPPAKIGLRYPTDVSAAINPHAARMIGAESAVRDLPREVERVGE